MAGEWIKMRVDLPRDPKVIAMAEYLTRIDAFWNHCFNVSRGQMRDERVTSRVTVSVTMMGLMRTWFIVRSQAKRDGEDMVMQNTTLKTITIISEVPHFGPAMESVGWAIPDEENHLVRFPKCYKHMTSPEERKREQDAERKRRQREKDHENSLGMSRQMSRSKSRSCPTDVTPREEKRREENTPLPPKGGAPGFDAFWSAYPRKTAKQAALRAWNKLKPDAALQQTILAALGQHSHSEQWTRDSGQFIPHPASWLNGKRWEDQLAPAVAGELPPTPDELTAKVKRQREEAEKMRAQTAKPPTSKEDHGS